MLKKSLVFLLSIFCVLSVWQANSTTALSQYGSPYEVYTQRNSSIAKIFNGNTVSKTKIFFKTGESVIVYKQYEQKIIELLEAKIRFIETTESGTSIYAYSKKLKSNIKVQGETVNVQIFYGQDKVVLGSPIILGSF